MTGSITDKFLAKAKKVMEVGSEAADVLVHLQHGASPIGLAAVGLRVLNSVRAIRAKTPEEYFAGWKPLDLGVLATQALAALRTDESVSVEEVVGVHDETPAMITRMDGVEIGWGISGSFKRGSVSVRSIWVQPKTELEPLFQRIGRALWDHIGSPEVCLTVEESSESSTIKIVAEDKKKIFPSAKGDEFYERIKKFQAKGIRRSFFIIGDPGVGKSCLLRYIASLQGGFRLRLRMSRLVKFNPHRLIRVVEILRPNVLIVDDFDRYIMGNNDYSDEEKNSDQGAAMLDPLEVFDELVPLVVVSANYSKSITPAALRPGRFAEMETIDEIDPEVYGRMLPGAPAKLIKKLKRLKVPVAYLEEIRLRAEALGWEETEKEVPKLIERSEAIMERNRRATSERRYRRVSTLVGKSPAQKAVMLDRQAAQADKRAARSSSNAATHRKTGAKRREQAETEREKVAKKAAKKAAATAAKKTKAPTKKRAKKRTKKRKAAS